jgi:dienelactone hydrolase
MSRTAIVTMLAAVSFQLPAVSYQFSAFTQQSAAVEPGSDPADLQARRQAFLKIIQRPRVPLAAESVPLAIYGPYVPEHVTFASEQGERVTAILLKARRRDELDDVSIPAGRRRPAVIVLHGTGARKEEENGLLRVMADRGFIAMAIDARHHGERARGDSISEYTAALLQAYRTGRGHPYMYDTVWDTMRAVDYLSSRPDVDATRIGLLGISKGGTETSLTAAVDPRVAVAIPVIGVQGFNWALEHDAWQARADTFRAALDGAARDAGGAGVDAALVRKFYARVSPDIDGRFDAPMMLPLIAPRPLLVINGDSDPRTPLPGVMESVAAAQRAYADTRASEKIALYLQPHSGHVFTPTAELVALDWLVSWLKP